MLKQGIPAFNKESGRPVWTGHSRRSAILAMPPSSLVSEEQFGAQEGEQIALGVVVALPDKLAPEMAADVAVEFVL